MLLAMLRQEHAAVTFLGVLSNARAGLVSRGRPRHGLAEIKDAAVRRAQVSIF
jgi:hypothetical protein